MCKLQYASLRGYTATGCLDAVWRVLVQNNQPNPTTYLHKWGHYEKSNVLTHLAANVVYVVYCLCRPAYAVGRSSAPFAVLSLASILLNGLMFLSSCIYHCGATVMDKAPFFRLLDYSSIYAAIGLSAICELAIVVPSLQSIDWRAVADPILGSCLVAAYFGLKTFNTDPGASLHIYFKKQCGMGLTRAYHSDTEHDATRAATFIALSAMWVLLVPSAFSMLGSGPGWLFVVAHAASGAAVAVGKVIDDVFVYPESVLARGEEPCCLWYMKDCTFTVGRAEIKCGGCFIGSHAIWHILSFLGIALVDAMHEYCVLRRLQI